jgi:predicted kinase
MLMAFVITVKIIARMKQRKDYPHYLGDDFLLLLRGKLDTEYHEKYSFERQHIQNRILRKLYGSQVQDHDPFVGEQWMIITAGSMGSGKSSVIDYLLSTGTIPISSPVVVDLDEIRNVLPESEYLKDNYPLHFGELTQKESGCVAELLIQISLYAGRNVILDGSLINLEWQRDYINGLALQFAQLKTLLLHVSADEAVIIERVKLRNEKSDRQVPYRKLQKSLALVNDWRVFLSFQEIVTVFVSVKNNSTIQNVQFNYPWHLSW